MSSRLPLRIAFRHFLIAGIFACIILSSHSAHAAALELNGTPLLNDPNLVSYWRLETNSTDTASSANNGSDTAISYSSGNGKFGQGAGFNGSTSAIVISDNAGLRLSTWTVSAWVKTSSIGSNPTGYEKIVYKGNSSSDEPISLYLYYGKPVLEAYKTGAYDNYALDTNTITDGEWHHLVGVRNLGVDMELYVDGVLVGSGSDNGGTSSNTSNVTIGERTNGDSTMNGSIDDVAIFSRALSADEISYLYNGPFSLLNQYRSDATTTIDEGAITTDNQIVFGAKLYTAATSTLQLQVEVESAGSNNFTGTPTVTSTFVSQGGYATTTYSLGPELSANGNYHWQTRVVDANNNSSTWEMFGPHTTSTDFTVQTVPLFTQIGSPYPSFASTSVVDGGWAGDTYDDGTIFCEGGNTIGYCGCAITSVAMSLRYFGITTDTLGDPVDPRTLNTWLTNDPNVGYDAGGNLEWNQITDYASSTSGSIILDPNSPSGYGTTISAMSPHINPLLASSTPVPVILVEPDHFVVATGLAKNNGTSTYNIRDSAWYLTQYLNQATSSGTSNTINGYQNNASGAFIFYDPPRVPRWGEYHVSLPDALMLVDAQGRRTGKDPATGTIYHEIPNTSYIEIGTPTTNGAGELFTSDLPNGRYALYVLGGKTTKYWLDASHYGQQHQSFKGTIQPGSMILYAQNYDMARLASSTFTFAAMASSTWAITSNPPHNLLPPPVPTPVQVPASPVSVPVSPGNLGRPLSGSPLNSEINLGTSTASSSSSQ